MRVSPDPSIKHSPVEAMREMGLDRASGVDRTDGWVMGVL